MALFPPIVASSMPAFNINNKKVRIYFGLSDYNINKIDQINRIHITVRRQNSNVNVVNNKYQIINKPFNKENKDNITNRYYVDIDDSEIKREKKQKEDKDTGFQVDVCYKVQLRFSTDPTTSVSFYTNNVEKFSEWSTVCIIKPIEPPVFYIDDFHDQEKTPKESDLNNFYYNLADFIGIYKQEKSSQTLKSWRLRLLDSSFERDYMQDIDKYTLADSTPVLASANNYTLDGKSLVLECSLPYELKQNSTYKLLFEIQTRNDYTDNFLYTFDYKPVSIQGLKGKITTSINEEEGYIKVYFQCNQLYTGNLVLRRTDSKSNFLKWEDLKNFEFFGQQQTDFTYYDFTPQSGVFYRYLIQKRDTRGRRGTPLYDSASEKIGTMLQYQHAFLLESAGNGDLDKVKQLKLKFDFQISSYKTNISESKTDTIGSKYPYIRRNGNMYYRSFPCTGTITGYMDNVDLFTNKTEMFNGYYNKYQEFNSPINNYSVQYDYTYQRLFREKVEEFLYNSKPKLYKSMQEGNIFIKLMQVSLTPKNELSRLIYTFSATAYQIEEYSLDTLNRYNFIDIGTYNPNLFRTKEVLGQLNTYNAQGNPSGLIFKAGQDIIGAGSTLSANSIAKKYKYNQIYNSQIITDFNINWLRITVESPPYLIIEQNGVYRPFDDIAPTDDDISGDINYKLYQIESTYNVDNVYLGTLFTINGQQIIISYPNNIYEIKEDNFLFGKDVQIIPAKDTAMLVDYRVVLRIQNDTKKDPKNIEVNKVNGQLMGKYSYSDNILSNIYYKYKYTFEYGQNKIKKYVNNINNIFVDTEPGTVIYEKTTAESGQATRFVVNETGQLNFDPNTYSTSISSLRIYGRNVPCSETRDRGSVESLDQVINPIHKDMCRIGDKLFYYYKSEWCEAVEQDQGQSIDFKCAVDALIFYFIDVRRDSY